MLLVIGSYQISVQRSRINEPLRAQQEARRLRLERQVEADRQRALHQFQQFSGSAR